MMSSRAIDDASASRDMTRQHRAASGPRPDKPPAGAVAPVAAVTTAVTTGAPAPGPAAGDPGGPPPPGLNVSTAHPARVWNYWLGGRDYFAADRAAGEQLSREFPHLAQAARAERAFLVRAVRFLAGPARIRQFLDIGAGLPADGNTHEIAQRVAPDAGILYLDNDPAVLLHAHTLLRRPDLASTPEGMVSEELM